MRTVFVGGPGRSGTSFVTRSLGMHPDVCTLPDIELKIFTEKNGLMDLYHSIVVEYSPNRAHTALNQFKQFYTALINGGFGQRPLDSFLPKDRWEKCFNRFTDRLTQFDHPMPATEEYFFNAARILSSDLFSVILEHSDRNRSDPIFLEKTPHALLSSKFIRRIIPDSILIHVIRDPRSIAYSLRRMSWGPDDLETCCAWVESYFTAWNRTKQFCEHNDSQFTQIMIEELSNSEEVWNVIISDFLDFSKPTRLFANADLQKLNGWVETCKEDDITLMNLRLSNLAEALGYNRTDVGRVTSDVYEATFE